MATKLDFGQAGPDANPELSALYRVEIDGIPDMSFDEFAPPKDETSVVESRTGIHPPYKMESAGLRSPLEIKLVKVLREGGVGDVTVYHEWKAGGSKDRRTGAGIQMDIEGNDLTRGSFTGAWIKSIEESEHKGTDENAVKTFTIVLSVATYSLEAA